MAISTHDFSYKVHMYYSTATDPSRLFSRTFHAVLLSNYSNNPRVTINKEPAQCCRHIVSHTTMQSRIIWHLTYTHTLTHTHTRLTDLCPGLPGWAGTRKVKPQSKFYWSKRQWVAVTSAGPYASLHLTPQIDSHTSTPPLNILCV